MQITPVYFPQAHPPLITNRQQQLTPASSVTEEEYTANNKLYRPRSVSDPRCEDDYYFYHTGTTSSTRGMTSRRSSIQSIGRRPEESDAKAPEQVRLPPITSLFAAVEPPPPPPPPPPPSYVTPREPQNVQFSREPPQSYYSTPNTYPHMPYRRQSIFSTYSASNTSSPQNPNYPPHSRHPPPHQQPGPTPYRTPSPPPYGQRHIPIPQSYPSTYIQPRPPPTLIPHTSRGAPSTFALTHRTNSASPAERYMCHECNKSFSRPSSLRIHTFSHTGEKPFVCPEPGCTKRFSVRSNMRRHMKVHSEGTGGPSEVVGGGSGSGQAESVKEEDVTSDNSTMSPGQHLPIRPRQGSRSSI